MKLTIYAVKISDELSRLHSMLFCVVTDNNGFNKRVADGHQARREKQIAHFNEHVKNKVPPGMAPTLVFEGPEPGSENTEYTAFLDGTLGEMTLCRAVDCYHWYLRQVILLILHADPSLLRPWSKKLKITNADELDAFERGEGREELLTKWFRGSEWKSRQLVHEHWKIPLKDDLGELVKVRNCIVHQLGNDVDQSLQPIISKNPRLSLGMTSGRLTVGLNGGEAAIQIVMGDVSIIDQCLARSFALPTVVHVPASVSRSYN
jgi:hypothetical protein